MSASLAILPLANASGDPDKDYFADGLTECLHSALVGVRALRVASRGASAVRHGQVARADLGRALDVAAVLEGSVTRLGGQLRLSASLHAAADGGLKPYPRTSGGATPRLAAPNSGDVSGDRENVVGYAGAIVR